MTGYADRAAKKGTADKTKGRPKDKDLPDRTKPMKFENESGKCGNPAEDNWRPGKRMNIQAQDTGRIQNKTIVSVESPDWMKSFFENNRSYFEKQGIAQKLKKPAGGTENAAGISSSAREKGKKPGTAMTCDETGIPLCQQLGSQTSPDWMNSARKWTKFDWTPQRTGDRAGQDRFTAETPRTKSRSAANLQHLVVSERVPEWMRVASAMEAVARSDEQSRPRARSADDLSRAAGVDTHRQWDETTRNKGAGNVHPTTGQVNYKSQQSPDFPLDSGREHRRAFEDTAKSAPNSARSHRDGFVAAGDQMKDRRSKKAAVTDQDTGKVANNSIVSVESPHWMKQPFENNRTFFEKQGVAQKLRTMSTQEHEANFVAGRRIPSRPKQVFKQIKTEEGKIQNLSIVSVGAPQWMKSPFESNRPFFEQQGIAQVKAQELAKEVQEEGSKASRPSSTPPRSKGPPSHAAERAQRRKSASEASATSAASSRRTSSAASTSYSARYTKELPRQNSLGSLRSARG
mmetsp:Transcript_30625/g.70677  ORF Transcript_30625/g.70677 Transcript_30625/m.70677 type:complete len:516 (-) Transcript_30625:212-1759(-)